MRVFEYRHTLRRMECKRRRKEVWQVGIRQEAVVLALDQGHDGADPLLRQCIKQDLVVQDFDGDENYS